MVDAGWERGRAPVWSERSCLDAPGGGYQQLLDFDVCENAAVDRRGADTDDARRPGIPGQTWVASGTLAAAAACEKMKYA